MNGPHARLITGGVVKSAIDCPYKYARMLRIIIAHEDMTIERINRFLVIFILTQSKQALQNNIFANLGQRLLGVLPRIHRVVLPVLLPNISQSKSP